MKLPRLRTVVLIVLGLPLLGVLIVNLNAPSTEALEPIDPEMSIQLPDGSRKPLSAILEERGSGASAKPMVAEAPRGESQDRPEGMRFDLDSLRDPDHYDLLDLGRHSLDEGRVEEAVAILRSIPQEHPAFARAQRFLGWDVYTRHLKRPEQGVAFVNRSILSDPLEGNAWQDGYRVYLRSLGLDLF